MGSEMCIRDRYEVGGYAADQDIVSLEERLNVLVEHSRLFAELLPFKNFAIMKKHYKAYVNSFPGAAELRAELMAASDIDEVEVIVKNFLQTQNFYI